LTLRDADPTAPPAIHPNYLDTEYDRRMMIAGTRLIRRLAETQAFGAVIDKRIMPAESEGEDDTTDASLLTHIRNNAWTVFHPCGTCRMGMDAGSVVDERLRVRGMDGLRVADAAIFPNVPSGNTNAPSIMVGERGADLVL